MGNYFKENRKLIGLHGILGRRDFIVNYLIIDLIEVLLWSIPLLGAILFKPDMLSNFLNSTLSTPASQPFIVVLGMAVLGLIIVPLYFSSIVRRVRDILGEEDDNRVYLVSSVLAVICYIAYTPVASLFMGKWLVLFTFLFLMCWEGKITSQKPASEIVKFNWGAFWGTWFWGSLNKVPTTLLAIPLMFTLGIFHFMLICGLKGNEWAYANSDKGVEDFHKTQSSQAVIFSIAAPFIIFFCMLFTSVTITSGVVMHAKSSPEFAKAFDNFVRSNQEMIVKSSFSNIELGDKENKFYINPVNWKDESQSVKISIFKTAVNYVVLKSDSASGAKPMFALSPQSDKDKILKIRKFIEAANKTKIYSSFNNELLGEFSLKSEEYMKALNNLKTGEDVKNLYKLLNSGYKLNEYPSLP